MNKIIKIVVCICFTFIVCGADLSYKVKAEDDFEINERDYIERCKSSEMSKKDIEICSQFNEYLKAKNENLKNSMSDLQSSIDDTEGQIDTLRDEIDAIDLQIQNKQEEINYASENINTLTNNIQELEESLKARLYAMQMYVNSKREKGYAQMCVYAAFPCCLWDEGMRTIVRLPHAGYKGPRMAVESGYRLP